MKKIILSLSLLAVSATVPFFVGGCAKEGFEQAAVTQSEALSLNNKLVVLISQINATNAALETVVSNPANDPQANYKAFSEAADKVISLDKDIQAGATTVQEHARKYVEQWTASLANYENEGLRKQSQAQREEYIKKFAKVQEATEEGSKAVAKYISKLNDARNYLSTNLSADGIKSAKSFAEKTVDEGKSAISSIKDVSKVVVTAANSTAPALPPPPVNK